MITAFKAKSITKTARSNKVAELIKGAHNWVDEVVSVEIENAAREGKDSLLINIPVDISMGYAIEFLAEFGFKCESVADDTHIYRVFW